MRVAFEAPLTPISRGNDQSPWSGGARIVNTTISATLRLCAFARMSLLIQAVVLAKAQRCKGRKGKILLWLD